MAWTPSSDSCIWREGVEFPGLWPAEPMKSPIMLMSGFNALAALPPAPPRAGSCVVASLTGAAETGGGRGEDGCGDPAPTGAVAPEAVAAAPDSAEGAAC